MCRRKIGIWTKHVENVGNMAKTYSQSTQTVATKYLQAECNFLLRVIQIEEDRLNL